MRFIHLADCHLASENIFEAEVSDFIRKKSRESFENILKANKDADFALLAGDLFERSFFTSTDYKRLFDLIGDFAKNIYYVTGNHDYISYDNQMFFMDKPHNLKIFPSDKLSFFEEGKTRIYGISYEDRIFSKDFPYQEKLDSNYFNILLVHGVVGESDSNYLKLDLEKLNKMGFDYVGLGHIHKPISVTNNIIYSGTTEAKNFSEDLSYGYITYDENGPERHYVSRIKFTSLSLKTSDFNDTREFTDHIRSLLDDKINFLRLEIINDSKFDLDEQRLKNDLGVFYLKIEEEKYQDLKNLKLIYKDSLLSRFLTESEKTYQDDKILQRAKELGIDAILRSKYD